MIEKALISILIFVGIVLAGCIHLLKLDSNTSSLVTTEVKKALDKIIFVKGSAI